MMKLVECVPNFSEGRDKNVVNQIAEAIKINDHVKILDVEMDPDHNRSVITFVSPVEYAVDAAFSGIKKAAELINMEKHRGAHPRFGAADVVPFVPLFDTTIEECVKLAWQLGERVGKELGIPVYLYEKAAKVEWRKNLADIRNESFQYEQLKEHIKEERWKPDFGPSEVGTAGATIIGAREFLIAFNVNLNTTDVSIAKKIAKSIREKTGSFKNVRALGFELKERNMVQVSMNLLNYKETPIYRVFEAIKMEAESYGVSVAEAEIIGLVPLDALTDALRVYMKLRGFKSDQVFENKLLSAFI